MSAYSILAKYYDALMGDFDYDGYFEHIKDLLSGEGVDLACGSGEMTARLAQNGAKMTGIDISNEMLNEAREKSKRLALNINWVNMDIEQLELNHCVDFMTCVCDGVNYIPTRNLAKFFDRVYANLKDGGKFVFDISSKYKLEEVIGGNLFCEDYEDMTYIWSNELKDGYVDMDIDFFEKVHLDLYKRIEESHRQYIHGADEIKRLLNRWRVEIYDGETYGRVHSKSKRIIFIAEKN